MKIIDDIVERLPPGPWLPPEWDPARPNSDVTVTTVTHPSGAKTTTAVYSWGAISVMEMPWHAGDLFDLLDPEAVTRKMGQ